MIKYIIAGLLIAATIGGIYHMGLKSGKAQVTALWNTDIEKRNAAIDAQKKLFEGKAETARKENQRLQDELNTRTKDFAVAITNARNESAVRLRNSEVRTSLYQRQSQAGSTQCSDLASYAAELDRTLEEGRGLVSELRLTLGQRDNEIQALSAQILSDRNLISGVADGR